MPVELLGSWRLFIGLCALGILAKLSSARVAFAAALCTTILVVYARFTPYAYFFAGYVISVIRSRAKASISHRWLDTTLLVIGVVVMISAIEHNAPATPTTLLAKATIIVSITLASKTCRKLLSSRLSQFLGQISFPLYLIPVSYTHLTLPTKA